MYDELVKNKGLDIMNDRLGTGKETSLELQALLQAGNPLRLDIGTPGALSTLRFVHDELPEEPLGPHDVELTVRANGVSFK